MRFYSQTHEHYCGVDLRARTMYVRVLNQEGEVVLQHSAHGPNLHHGLNNGN